MKSITLVACFAIVAMAGLIVWPAYASSLKECVETETQITGGCSGTAPCNGSKVRTEYDGCYDCKTTSRQGATCDKYISPWDCQKRSQVTPCKDDGGFCIEDVANPMGSWATTEENYCDPDGSTLR
jgi:hypothetical protein